MSKSGQWTFPAAFWVTQALRSTGSLRELKWERARFAAPWLSERAPEGTAAEELMLEVLSFMASETEHRLETMKNPKLFMLRRDDTNPRPNPSPRKKAAQKA